MKRVFFTIPVLLLDLTPGTAEACGGTFCDGGNGPTTTMPVDQSAEDLLFVRDGEFIETHVRIHYEGEAENFAWIVPVMGAPTFAVGSEPMFQMLTTATAPQFVVNTVNNCSLPGGTTTGGGSGFVQNDSAVGGPDVVLQQRVGAFEAVVLAGGSGASVLQWLDDNGYRGDPEAEPILDEYISEGHHLAAFRIAADATTDSIHPVVIRHLGTEPCVPLRLTAVAAVEDMGIHIYGLGTERLVPGNYQGVELNWLHLEGFVANEYRDLVTLAVDEAGGQAFTTEFASAVQGVPHSSLWDPSWDADVFRMLPPLEALSLLGAQGLLTHPLVQSLVRQYIPTPSGVEDEEFWNWPDDYSMWFDPSAWEPDAFSDQLDETVLAPAFEAYTLFETWPYLTRMYTTVSPHEMTRDPFFEFVEGLPDVNRFRSATRTLACTGVQDTWQVDGHLFCEDTAGRWPQQFFGTPYATRIERYPTSGPPVVEADNSDAIAAAVDEAFDAYCGPVDPGGDGGSDGGNEEGSTEGTGDGGAEEGALIEGRRTLGCGGGCASNGDSPRDLGLSLWLLPLGIVWRRRRNDR